MMAAFLAARGGDASASPDLARALGEAIGAARAAFPEIALDPQNFAHFLAERVPRDAEPANAVASLHAADLYLTMGCLERDRRAIAAFEARYLAKLPMYLAKLELPAATVEELRQTLAQRLLAGTGHAPPKIGGYGGRGALDGWVRVAAIRTALAHLRRGKREEPLDADAAARAISTDRDPEMDIFKRRYGPHFERALRDALLALPPRDRTVLRMRFLDSLGVNQLASVFGVHRTTITRWLGEAQLAVLEGTRRQLREQLGLSATECEHLIDLVRSRLETTLHGLLATLEPP